MTNMAEEYSDNHCHDCGEDLLQLDGNWMCPECDGMDSFQLVNRRDSFQL
jgi:uncharacterized Zn finger protein (UPF0148 family)